jgi:hypothetical protein
MKDLLTVGRSSRDYQEGNGRPNLEMPKRHLSTLMMDVRLWVIFTVNPFNATASIMRDMPFSFW